ncbi:MAG: hypothetical protein ABFR97_02340 [Thermodesulfobacteriota bacterium]
MDNDITDFLSIEIKREMADRYFTFRKMIEEDNSALSKGIALSVSIEQMIVIDLSRLYILMQERDLIDQFIELSGLQHPYFFDDYLIGSPTIKARLFQDVKVWGLTWGGRFKKMFLECYDDLVRHVDKFRSIYTELANEQAMLKESIDLFYRQNDISAILGFLRGMDTPAIGGGLEGGIDQGFNQSMSDKMQIKPPPPLNLRLPMFPPLIPSEQIKSQLKGLASQALEYHPKDFLKQR